MSIGNREVQGDFICNEIALSPSRACYAFPREIWYNIEYCRKGNIPPGGNRMFVTENIPLALQWDCAAGELLLLDQRLLPEKTVMLRYRTADAVRDAISAMVVRGAPAIGVAAAYGMALAARELPDEEGAFFAGLLRKSADLAAARPTAVNLVWAVKRVAARAELARGNPVSAIRAAMLDEAQKIHTEDETICRGIGEALQPVLRDGMGVLTHCNAGQLATSRYGTALAPVYLAMERGVRLRVFADETRPRLQGSTLTAYELLAAGADVTVLCDNMAAAAMAQGKIDLCIVGCDRVARNGDTANKIGTLNVAILAKHFGIPFYVAAPTPTIDPGCPDGSFIPIEERDEAEVTMRFGQRTAPAGVKVWNPSFDVTPNALITGFATEKGILLPPFDEVNV